MYGRSLSISVAVLAFAAHAASAGAAVSSSSSLIETTGTPSGFDALAQPREIAADIYFGGQKVGEATAIVRPGFLRFKEPANVAALVPNLVDPEGLVAALSGDLPSNSNLVCTDGNRNACGVLSPEVAGIIFDEDSFRVDLFVAPRLLRAVAPEQLTYLPTPAAPLSLTSSMGLALSGSSGTSTAYNFQTRTIIGFRNARIRSDASYASHFGMVFDDLVGEIDRPDLRYSGGLFWAPGIDLIGERRIVGIGLGTQFDTRADKDQLGGTPLVVFLAQPARVDILIDNRLVGSRAYDAGNNILDTSGLPDGSYAVVLRIHEANGSVHDEHRFFAKNAQIAPLGRPLYFAYAGVLANTTRGTPISLSRTPYYQLGTARRLSPLFAADASIIGTDKKAIAEIGSWFITPYARIRAAGLVSTAGDRGALLQLQSADIGGLNVTLDFRRIWSRDDQPLVPLPSVLGSFDSAPPTASQIGGSYAQASGSIGYRLGSAYLAVIGSFRKDAGIKSDYTVGPDLSWPVVTRPGFQLTLDASAQRTRTTTAGFLGFRILSTMGRVSLINSTGYSSLSSSDGSTTSVNRATGGLSAQYSYEGDDRTQVSVGGGFDRNLDSTVGHVGGFAYTRFGNIRGDVLRNFEGSGGTQYGLTLQTGAAIDPRDLVVGGRDINESALVVTVEGPADYPFEVLVNDQPRGRIVSGARLPLFLQPYHSYKVRLRPLNAAGVSYDSAARDVTLYPGNVQHLDWKIERMFTVFGQAVRADGRPLADATIQSRHGVGESDGSGYFQIDAGDGEALRFTDAGGSACEVRLADVKPVKDFASLGKVVCQ